MVTVLDAGLEPVEGASVTLALPWRALSGQADPDPGQDETVESDEGGLAAFDWLPDGEVIYVLAEREGYLPGSCAVRIEPDAKTQATVVVLVALEEWQVVRVPVESKFVQLPGGAQVMAHPLENEAPEFVEIRFVPLPPLALTSTAEDLESAWWDSPTLTGFELSMVTPDAEGVVFLELEVPLAYDLGDLAPGEEGKLRAFSLDREAMAWVPIEEQADYQEVEWAGDGYARLYLGTFSQKKIGWRPKVPVETEPSAEARTRADFTEMYTFRPETEAAMDWQSPFGILDLKDKGPGWLLTVPAGTAFKTGMSRAEETEVSKQTSEGIEEQARAQLGGSYAFVNAQLEVAFKRSLSAKVTRRTLTNFRTFFELSGQGDPCFDQYLMPAVQGHWWRIRHFEKIDKEECNWRIQQGQKVLMSAELEGDTHYYKLTWEKRAFLPDLILPTWVKSNVAVSQACPAPLKAKAEADLKARKPPYLVKHLPAANTQDVGWEDVLVLEFSRAIDPASLMAGVRLEPTRAFSVKMNDKGTVATLTFRYPAVPNLSYRVTVSNDELGVKDPMGAKLAAETVFWFHTRPVPKPAGSAPATMVGWGASWQRDD
jgi:hypothetical protein